MPPRNDQHHDAAAPWIGLDGDLDALIEEMRAAYAGLAAIEEQGERQQRLEAIARWEYSREHDAMRRLTAARLRAWLALAAERPSLARALGEEYEQVMSRLPAELDFRRAMATQSVFGALTASEQVQLLELAPGMQRFAQRERVLTATRSTATKPPQGRLARLAAFLGRRSEVSRE